VVVAQLVERWVVDPEDRPYVFYVNRIALFHARTELSVRYIGTLTSLFTFIGSFVVLWFGKILLPLDLKITSEKFLFVTVCITFLIRDNPKFLLDCFAYDRVIINFYREWY